MILASPRPLRQEPDGEAEDMARLSRILFQISRDRERPAPERSLALGACILTDRLSRLIGGGEWGVDGTGYVEDALTTATSTGLALRSALRAEPLRTGADE